MTARRQSEKVEQASIVRLLRSIGCLVHVLGTHRRAGDWQGTMQTPGIPDLHAFLPRHTGTLWVEVKAAGGKASPEQVAFQEACQACRQPHVMGGLDAVIAWLLAHGYLTEGQVPHYRLPPVGTPAPGVEPQPRPGETARAYGARRLRELNRTEGT